MARLARCIGPVLVFILLAALPVEGRAQTTGTVRGLVTDEAGRPLEGVALSIASAAAGRTGRGAVSDATGGFHVGSLPPQTDYEVLAVFPGFTSVRLSAVNVSAGQTTLVRIQLRSGTILREKIEVRARAQPVVLEAVTTQTEFSSEFIDAMPILGRNYQDILALAPGVTDIDGDGNPNIHGARDTDVITLVDGVSTTDPLTGKIGAQLNIESIQEIEVKTSGATAEFSRAQGGFANIITKSGGNDFQGTFKVFWQGSLLDGDGAGIDDPRLHGGLGESGLRDLRFNDILPFLSFEGPIVRDRAWFFTAHEYVRTEEPVNALSSAFVAGVREFREFAKATWQASANQRLSLSLNYDPQEYLNQGLNSLIAEESGFTLRQGGPILTFKVVSVLGPTVSLETSASSFDERPVRQSTIDPDTNGNGVQWLDRNGNGFIEAVEADPGEDYDRDGAFDVFEDKNRNGFLDLGEPSEDRDGDRRLTAVPRRGSFSGGGCEGARREDTDCDGRPDRFDEDLNANGRLDAGEDIDNDGRLDRGTEDRNDNRFIDDRPRPGAEGDDPVRDENGVLTFLYPYGRLAPLPGDRPYTIDQQRGVTTGPFFEDFSDSRRRFTLRQDLSLFQPDSFGSHDVKMGYVVEREVFDRVTTGRPIIAPVICQQQFGCLSTVRALLPADRRVENEATNLTSGFYVQDSYKPFPNLSIGLGLRLDREVTDSFGYSPFDPAFERAQFDRLNLLINSEDNDLLQGNNDGILSRGVVADPIFQDTVNPVDAAAFIVNPVRIAALARLTRHHTEANFTSQQLVSLFPDIKSGGEVDAKRLAELGVLAQRLEPFRLTNNNLAPRLSLSWDPWSDGRTKVFATWGRYYDKLFLSTIVGEEGPDTINRYYLFDRDGLFGDGLPNNRVGAVISKAPPSATQVDRGLQTPWSDEFTFGAEREIAPEMALSLTYIARRFRQQLQDIDLNHTLRFDPDTGRPIDRIGLVPTNFSLAGTTSSNRAPDGRPDLFIHNFFFNQVLRVGNFNESRYRAVELALVKRLARRWEMKGSYAYSRALGAAEDFQSRLGNDPSTVESEFGYLDYDQRHIVKLSGITFLPGDWQVGVAASWSSGPPYSVISRFFALDNADYQQFRTRYGFVGRQEGVPTFQPLRRNSGRNDAVYDLSLRARKTFVLGRNTAGVFLEAFNVLNTDDLRIVSFEQSPPDLGGALVPQTPLQLTGTRRFGRRFQIGLQFDF